MGSQENGRCITGFLHKDLARLAEENPVVKEWIYSRAKIERYRGGEYDGYRFRPGKRLIIRGEQVMDSCETPWARKTVDLAFHAAKEDNPFKKEEEPMKVLEFGFGLGITANHVLRYLSHRSSGGEYRVVELNKQVFENSENWRKAQLDKLQYEAELSGEEKPPIKITTYHGEAGQVAEDLVKRGKKFDIVISDTFPLTEEETGINDLVNLPIYVDLLDDDGVFAFFPFVPMQEDPEERLKIYDEQANRIRRYFRNTSHGVVEVKPPPSYKYLQGEKGPIRQLPVMVCSHPIKNVKDLWHLG